MKIIPVINCDEFNCVRKKIVILNDFLPADDRRIHIDISDGIYATKPEWNNPEELNQFLLENNFQFDISVHFMVQKPCDEIKKWASLITKAVVPLDCGECCERFIRTSSDKNISFSLSIPPNKSVGEAVRYSHFFSEFQILAVSPGPSGQKMSENTIEKIKELRALVPSAIIEVDGGANPETAPKFIKAGANIVLSGSYIFNSTDPKSAYLKLKES